MGFRWLLVIALLVVQVGMIGWLAWEVRELGYAVSRTEGLVDSYLMDECRRAGPVTKMRFD